MKILHISTSDRGGAGIAAKRLHLGLLNAGVESKMLCLQVFDKTIPNIFEYSKLPVLTFKQRLLLRLKLFKPSWLKKQQLLKDKKGKYEIYTFPFSDYRIHEHPLAIEADIINLHWVADFLDYNSFFININKPVVWTLHDMNPFLGGFHYMDDVDNNKKVFQSLEQKLTKIKFEVYSQFDRLHIVTLSNYIKNISQNSELLKRYPHHLIRNSYEPMLSSEVNKNCCKKVFDIPTNKKIILFVSQHINNHRKGFDILIESISEINLPEEYLFVAIGAINKNIPYKNIIWLGEIHEQKLIEMAYKMADVFILPSREDNLPNTMLEALTQGIPVISFAKGGMQDIIKDNNGVLLKECSSKSLELGINQFLNNASNYSNELIKQEALQIFSFNKQAKAYRNLYQSIINE